MPTFIPRLTRIPWPDAAAGALAAGVAIAVSELLAGLAGTPSLVIAVGSLLIALQPPGAKDLVVALFGTNDKLALNVLIVVVAVALAAAAGILSGRRFRRGALFFIVFGLVAAVAAARQPLVSTASAGIGAMVAVGSGLAALRLLLSLAPGGSEGSRDGPEWSRRRFLIAGAGTLGGVVVAGGMGRGLLEGNHGEGVVSSSRLLAPLRPAEPLAAGQVLATPGLSPLVVSNDKFYRIDTALLVPNVDVRTWRLEVKGMVDRPGSLTYDELLAMPLFEQYVTISCVSNEVGGHLVGNALWTGVRLKDVLEAAGVQAGATQIVGRSVDDFTVGFPTAWAMAPEREPMIALGMNREPLPAAHGFPARLIIPGLYGYVSATKWLSSIELTTREAVDGYWIPLGWAKDAPILTQSRIEVPADGGHVSPGPVDIAGVAWAPDRGVARVEVRIDDGAWQPAKVSPPISKATWVQWVLPWTATAGQHRIEVRATDGTGVVQTDQVTRPNPDGARGHHQINVAVG